MNSQLKALADVFFKIAFAAPEKVMTAIYEKKAVKTLIDRPIIIIGPDRSGTSFVYSLLANHPDLCALTAAASLAPDHPFSASMARRILSFRGNLGYRALPNTNAKITGGLIVPREAIHYWFRHLGSRNGGWTNAVDDYFTEEDLDDTTRQMLPLDLKKRLFILKKKRFVFKQPAFSLKIRYLNAIFPDAIFVHCIRNPFDNFLSLMKQKEQTGKPDWGLQIPESMRLRNASVEAHTAQQLAVTYELILQSINLIENGSARYLPVRYETFQSDFAGQIQKLFRHCDLDVPQNLLKHPEIFFVQNRGRGTSQCVTNDEQALQILKKLNREMGYDDFSAIPLASTAN